MCHLIRLRALPLSLSMPKRCRRIKGFRLRCIIDPSSVELFHELPNKEHAIKCFVANIIASVSNRRFQQEQMLNFCSRANRFARAAPPKCAIQDPTICHRPSHPIANFDHNNQAPPLPLHRHIDAMMTALAFVAFRETLRSWGDVLRYPEYDRVSHPLSQV